ncbi:MAG: hypothetical protein B0D91_11320 [Oceanospirillales bacterium LUC14_002_19_P2]|nr:MAG: hypothetical protein B0D91_11320 [Oceanospirillales bacterium LUC14_002_19_P2]
MVLMVLSFIFSTVGTASTLRIYGALTTYGEYLQSLEGNALPVRSTHKSLIYLNAADPLSKNEQLDIEDMLIDGHTLMIDGTESDSEALQSISALLGGVGLGGQIIMIHKPKGESPQYKQISAPESDYTTKNWLQTIINLAQETLALEGQWIHPPVQMRAQPNTYKPSERLSYPLWLVAPMSNDFLEHACSRQPMTLC